MKDSRLNAHIARMETGRFRGLILASRPGCGKTAVAHQLVKEPKHIVRVPVGNKDFQDFGSFYVPSKQPDGEVFVSNPLTINEIRPLLKSNIEDEYGILIIDDVTSNAPQVQNSLLELVQFGRVGEHQLGDNVLVVLTGNNSGEGTVFAAPWSDALLSRCDKLDYQPNYKTWKELECNQNISPAVIGFLDEYNEIYFAPLPGDEKASDTLGRVPCPRDWTAIGLSLKEINDGKDFEPDILYSALSDFICAKTSRVAGMALNDYVERWGQFPTSQELLDNPNCWFEIPDDQRKLPSTRAGMAFGLRSYILSLSKTEDAETLSKQLMATLNVMVEGNYEIFSFVVGYLLDKSNDAFKKHLTNLVFEVIQNNPSESRLLEFINAHNKLKHLKRGQ